MFYKKNFSDNLSNELFINPTCEYRGTPFWAWNSKLGATELLRQIDCFKEMGFGGFHMHVRQGLETEYMSEEFLSAIKECVKKAKKEEMLAWLYDEDRWPSGVAGGKVTKKLSNRQKYLTMTKNDRSDCANSEKQAAETGKPFYIATFDIEIDSDGKMLSFKKIGRNEPAKFKKRHFFLEQSKGGEPRYNYQSYVDTMSTSATDDFIKETHEKLKSAVGEEFGGVVPAIFTDEPQLAGAVPPWSGFDERDVLFSWTTDFQKTYLEEYGSDLVEFLPYLYFYTDDEKAYEIRYNYHTHVAERFFTAYMDRIGNWCEKNGIACTGHVVGEDALYENLLNNADVMRAYKNMQIPGIDILCDDVVFNTPIQCRSAVRQYGREAMLAELYGVTGWDFDFRGYKYQGDWLACLGVSIRVPHLAWQSMKGEGKRDYPAAISYQSPWYKEFKYIEDHYARINTALTRGTPDVKVAVIFPIDTYKMVFASLYETKAIRTELDTHYAETAKWLLAGGFDFDYISEALLPELCENGDFPLSVGKMKYDAVIVSDCMTLRPHTIKVLNEFKNKGGKVIIKGRKPYLSNGKPSNEAKAVSNGAIVISHSESELMNAVKEFRSVDIRKHLNARTDNLMCTTRNDGDDKWVFIAHMNKPELPHLINCEKISVTVKGCFIPYLYNTLSGEIKLLDYKADKDSTTVYCSIYNLDTLLIKFVKSNEPSENFENKMEREFVELNISSENSYKLSEPNVLLLDMAEYSIDGNEFRSEEEIMRIDDTVRKELNLQSRRTKFVQPWAVANSPEEHQLSLRYSIESEVEVCGAKLALEHPENTSITFNGQKVEGVCGFYMDRDIKTVDLPKIEKGKNTLILTMPFGLRTDVESAYIIGDFGTECKGRKVKIIQKPEKLWFGDIVNQGLTFYGGNITYLMDIDLEKQSDIELCVSNYRGAVVGVKLDGENKGRIAFPPFNLCINNVDKGKHKLELTLFGTRYNTLTALHNANADKKRNYIGPDYWRTINEAWTYEYNFRPLGILKTPTLRIRK